jgi:stage II sporulation protein D
MISNEPLIRVGIIDRSPVVGGVFLSPFAINGNATAQGTFEVRPEGGVLVLRDGGGHIVASGHHIGCIADRRGRFLLKDVIIGLGFHWERKQDQTFEGGLRFLLRENGTVAVVNDVLLEDYLTSVISSEMSAEAPLEFLKAHAITSRSWLVAMLERSGRGKRPQPPPGGPDATGEVVRWYTREDHDLYDVCADDHCQRYQGVSSIVTAVAHEAVAATRGQFLVFEGEICDARFYKACGGRTEEFHNAWEDMPIPYLTSIADAPVEHEPITTEERARAWILSQPEAYCNTKDPGLLKQVLPSFDRETTDFFRWTVSYTREELEDILRTQSGFDIGSLIDLVPLRRGPSGRITRLKIIGSKRTLIVGKELEIRRWLSRSHLYSSAFLPEIQRGRDGHAETIVLRGAGWGHGVGLCQIGAASMCAKGFAASDVVMHYFPGARVKQVY